MILLFLKIFLVLLSARLIEKAWSGNIKWDIALPLTFINLILVIVIRVCE